MKIEVNKNKISFSEHNDIMRLFRKSHANIAMVNRPRSSSSPLPQSTRIFLTNRIRRDTGGVSLLVNCSDSTSFPLIPIVASYKLSPN